MDYIKKHAFKIVLLLILLFSSVSCIYTIYNYKSTANSQISFQGNHHGNFQGNLQNAPRNNTSGNPQGNSQNTPGNKPSDNSQGNSQNSPRQPGQNMPGSNGFQKSGGPSPNNQMRSQGSTSGNYSYAFIAYALLFIAVSILAYYLFMYKKISIKQGHIKFLLITLLASAFLLRISLSALIQGHPGDINIFKGWASSAAKSLTQFYSNSRSSDYPPLYIYILSFAGKIGNISLMAKYYTLLLKMPSILADIAASFFIYKIARKRFSSEISILLSAFYAYNPAIFINSTLWGQVDSLFALIVAASVYLLSEKKIVFSTILFTAAVFMKPQGIIFLPVLFFELVREKNWKLFVKAAVTALIAAVIIILPFSINKSPLWIISLYKSTISEYPYASLNAYNFFGLIGANYVKDTSTLFIFSYHTWGMIFIVLITLFSWYIYIRKNDSTAAAASALVLIAGVFTFSVGMHERYLLPAVILSILAFIYLRDKRILLLALGFSSTVYINTHMVLFQALNGNMNSVSYNPVMIITSLINILLFVYLAKIVFDYTKTPW